MCLWRPEGQRDRRLDSDITSFEKFRNSLKLFCDGEGQAANVELRPDNSWPDVVYYHSYTHPGMGWKINIVDRFGGLTRAAVTSGSNSNTASKLILLLLTAFLIL